MWTIKRIDEADFGCEERMPGEELMVLVTLESDDGDIEQLEVADKLLTLMNLNEDDEWILDIDGNIEKDIDKNARQAESMQAYFDSLDETNKEE